jgi:hypothetical protein
VGRAAQAGKCRLVEDPLEDLVAPAHPTVVADPLSGVVSGRHEACVGGELVGALEGLELSHAHQELGPEDRTHAWQASEYPSAAQLDLRGSRQKHSLMCLLSRIGASTYVFGVWCEVFATIGTAM